jgi:hypothetical protein
LYARPCLYLVGISDAFAPAKRSAARSHVEHALSAAEAQADGACDRQDAFQFSKVLQYSAEKSLGYVVMR